MNDDEIRSLRSTAAKGGVLWYPDSDVARVVTSVGLRSDEPGPVAWLAGFPQRDYVALDNCELADFCVTSPIPHS